MIKDVKQISNQVQYSCCNHQILNLKKQLNRALCQNKKIHSEISLIDPNFRHILYQPSKHQGIADSYLKSLIVRQIDKLMEESQMLAKKKQRLNFRKHDSRQDDQNIEEMTDINHYAFLRKTWTKFQSKQENSNEKIDQLNKIIRIVRNGIKKLQEKQQQNIQKQIEIEEYNNKSYNETIIERRKKQMFERLKMKNQELQMKCFQLEERLILKNKKIQILQNQLLLTLNKNKSTIETQINLQEQSKYLHFNSLSDNCKITIQSNKIKQAMFDETSKNFCQILNFLKGKIQVTPIKGLGSIQSLSSLNISPFNLNCSNQPKNTLITDRFFSHTTKFIPMKTQSSSLMKQHTLKQSTNVSNNSKQILHSPQAFTLDIPNSGKKFSRKVLQAPLTSDRSRRQSKLKMQENKFDKIVSQKLEVS